MLSAENLKIYALTKGNHYEHTGGHSLKDQAAGVEVLKLRDSGLKSYLQHLSTISLAEFELMTNLTKSPFFLTCKMSITKMLLTIPISEGMVKIK